MPRPFYFRQVPGLDTRLVDGEAFVITPTTIRHLNPAASLVWMSLEQPSRRGELTEILSAFYPEEPRARLAADVKRILAQFLSSGLATRSQSPC